MIHLLAVDDNLALVLEDFSSTLLPVTFTTFTRPIANDIWKPAVSTCLAISPSLPTDGASPRILSVAFDPLRAPSVASTLPDFGAWDDWAASASMSF